MPAKIARLATRPPFWIPEVSVAVAARVRLVVRPKNAEYSWQIGSHPGVFRFKWFEAYGWKPWKTDRDYDFPLFNNYWLAYAAALK